MTVWVVTNGTGGELDSVWDSAGAAHARANALNGHGSFMPAWSVVEMTVQQVG